MKTRNILSLSSSAVKEFMLSGSDCYSTLELPEYYNFSNVLAFVSKTIGNKPYEECKKMDSTIGINGINHVIMLNKDGQYGVRPLTIPNPYSYYFLVREMCSEENWKALKNCFANYRAKNFSAPSIPVIAEGKEDFHMAGTILNSWWKQFEQKSVEMGLYYKYMFMTDITNCYGSIMPQSIEDALIFKGTAKENMANMQLAKNINTIIKDMQGGVNVGIPQGSVIFDLIAEVVLGYADMLLAEALEKSGYNTKCFVLRYRDDYRIFCNEKDILEKISFMLQNILGSLGFLMNTKKTRISDDIVKDAVKPEKLDYIYNTPITHKYGYDFDGLQKHLMYILLFARQHPNSNYVKNLLGDFDKRIKLLVDVEDGGDQKKAAPIELIGNIKPIMSIATRLVQENIPSSPNVLQVIARMAKSLGIGSEKWWNVVKPVYMQLTNLPNSDYLKIWLQNLTLPRELQTNDCPYKVPLCRAVHDKDIMLWNNSWLRVELTVNFCKHSFIDHEVLEKTAGEIRQLGRKHRYDCDVETEYVD